jgi:hypothetical protein
MIYIAHRGNLNGPNPSQENNPVYIREALGAGWDAEVDVWLLETSWWLGHDKPTYRVESSFFRNKGLWCHAKNVEALEKLVALPWVNCFWHQNDDCVVTSKKFIWTFPGKSLTSKSIAVMPEAAKGWVINEVAGICTDYVEKYQKEHQK